MGVTAAERAACAAGMARALRDSGLPQAEFAAAIGTSGPRFSTYKSGRTIPSAAIYLRAQRLADGLAAAAQLGVMSAPTTADLIGTSFAGNDEDWAWRMLLQGRDHLRLILAEHPDAAPAWEAAPTTTGAIEWDTLLAALTAAEFATAGTPAPGWTDVPPLAAPWIPEHPFLDEHRVVAATPGFLRALNIFVPDRDLATA